MLSLNSSQRARALLLLSLILGSAAVLFGARASWTGIARAALALVGVGAAVVWWSKRPAPGAEPAPRLELAARLMLHPKCSLALVQVDGRPFLVTFGEGFAQLQSTAHARSREEWQDLGAIERGPRAEGRLQ